MKYKLICIDMDGTLLNSKHRVSGETKEVIEKAYAKGVDIVITTGRIYANAAFYSKLIGVKSPVIASNGAIIRGRDNNIIYKNVLSSDTLSRIFNVCSRLKGNITLHTHDSIICSSKFAYIVMWVIFIGAIIKNNENTLKIKYVKNCSAYINGLKESNDIIKCEIIDKDVKKISAIREELKRMNDIEVVSSSRHNIEVTSKNVSKGNAIKSLAEFYGIKREEIITIGDSENDLSMIEYGGLGVVMENGCESAKKLADYITDTNDNNGVAKVIKKFIMEDGN
ncbi:HAD family hydrolase [Clostridium acetobutylicum]|nr:HAD family hydrolase [Clostridium acetobutylicum]